MQLAWVATAAWLGIALPPTANSSQLVGRLEKRCFPATVDPAMPLQVTLDLLLNVIWHLKKTAGPDAQHADVQALLLRGCRLRGLPSQLLTRLLYHVPTLHTVDARGCGALEGGRQAATLGKHAAPGCPQIEGVSPSAWRCPAPALLK